MKSQKGITLISLVITIIIMSILAGVATYSGLESIKSAEVTAFRTELEMIHAKVNVIYQKIKTNNEDKQYYNNIGQDISVVSQEKLLDIFGENSTQGFRYFSKEDLNQIDLENISQEVLINYDTREVISLTGIEINGITYYKLKDLPNYTAHNVEYIDKNIEAPEFIIEQTKLSDAYRVTIKNTDGSDINSGSLSYKLQSSQNWILNGTNMSFIAKDAGTYDIKLTNSKGNSTIKDVYINNEIYREDFNEFDYESEGTVVNSCTNSILDVTSTNTGPIIYMYNITSFRPLEHRYVEIKYKTDNNSSLKLFMIENPTDETYMLRDDSLVTDGEWHIAKLDLWSNENVKNMDKITGWRFDWSYNQQVGVSMQIDYIRIF